MNKSPTRFFNLATRLGAGLVALFVVAGQLGCSATPPALLAPPDASKPTLWWQESFAELPAAKLPAWESPSKADPAEVAAVLSVVDGADGSFLRARHAAPAGADNPPAVHFGKAWHDGAAPLDKACFLSWKWRVTQHPAVKDDAWLDVAASVYVIVRMPGLFGGGRGFKFGWLAKPGKKGEKQRGLYQIAQRVGPATDVWQTERVDLCSLYRSHYESNSGEEKVLYVGIVTDADNTESVAAADYDDFRLSSE